MDRILRNTRIGIDIDSKNRFRLLKTYFNARYLFGDKIRVFETNHGYHLRVYVKNKPMPELSLLVRAILGDDPKRLYVDERRLRAEDFEDIDTLFSVKSKNQEREINVFSEQFYLLIPRE